MRAAAAVVVTASLGLGLAACSDAEPDASPPPTTTTSVRPAAQAPLGFSDADNGHSATVPVGQRITVILHSSEFVFRTPSDPEVLRADGEPTVNPGGESCVETPGSGCGTVVASFVGLAPGDTALQADRATCAEPACAPADAHWALQLHVIDGAARPTTTLAQPTGTVALPTTTLAPGSEVRGTVLFSPVCPVERDPPEPACAPRPGPATVEVTRADGSVVAQTSAGDDGGFAMTVPPGTYTVRGVAPQPAIGGGCQTDPPEVTVEPGTSSTVTVTCDTGIR